MEAGALRLPNTSSMVRVAFTAVVSGPVGLHSEPTIEHVCQLPAFCKFASELQRTRSALWLRTDTLILAAHHWNVERECANSRTIVPDDEFFRVTTALYNPDNANYKGWCTQCSPRFAHVMALKWYMMSCVQYDVVVLVDLDLDFPNFNATMWQHALQAFGHSTAKFAAPFDWAVPVHGGAMTFRPNRTTYNRGIALMRKGGGLFNVTHGLGHVGKPQSLGWYHSAASQGNYERKFRRNRMYLKNCWDFPGAPSDQGLFSLFLHEWGQPKDRYWPIHGVTLSHFWAAWKPQRQCRRWVESLQLTSASICHETVAFWKRNATTRCDFASLAFL